MEDEEKIGMAITTVSTKPEAIQLGSLLVETRVAACVQIDRIESIYRWEGSIEVEEEIRLMIKYPIEKEEDLTKVLLENHSYDTPELIFQSFSADQAYLSWCKESCDVDLSV